MIVILIGPPGSGKGTQGALLSKKIKVPHLSIGDVLRSALSHKAEDNALIQQSISSGKFIHDDLVNKIIKNFLCRRENLNGYILDGYPRNILQAEYFDKNIYNNQEIKILFFNLSEDTIVDRVCSRLICSSCGRIYNSLFLKPKVIDICDNCGGDDFLRRKDDHEVTIKTRIEEYKKQTFPLLDYYKNNSNFFLIDASLEITEISLVLHKILKID